MALGKEVLEAAAGEAVSTGEVGEATAGGGELAETVSIGAADDA